MDEVISVADAVRAAERLWAHVRAVRPKARALREQPLLHRLPTGELVRGFIDLLLEDDEGYVVIDHKTYALDAAASVEKAKTFAGQLRAYRSGVEAANPAKPVVATWVHMPLAALMLEVA